MPDFEIGFTVMGVPVSQGSMKAFVIKGTNRAVVTHGKTKELMAWRLQIAHQTGKARPEDWQMEDSAIWLEVVFVLPRPKSLPKRVIHDIKRPDLDKLLRALLDAMTGVLYKDDSQVIDIHAVKQYSEPGKATGVIVKVRGESASRSSDNSDTDDCVLSKKGKKRLEEAVRNCDRSDKVR